MKEYNPPAYPSKKRIYRAGYETEFEPVNGMTLLDHFAGLAMQALIASGKGDVEATCSQSFRFANTMLTERQKWIK